MDVSFPQALRFESSAVDKKMTKEEIEYWLTKFEEKNFLSGVDIRKLMRFAAPYNDPKLNERLADMFLTYVYTEDDYSL